MDPRIGACLACLTAAQDAAALEPRRLAAQMQEEVRTAPCALRPPRCARCGARCAGGTHALHACAARLALPAPRALCTRARGARAPLALPFPV
jgi:hypothetical protein